MFHIKLKIITPGFGTIMKTHCIYLCVGHMVTKDAKDWHKALDDMLSEKVVYTKYQPKI